MTKWERDAIIKKDDEMASRYGFPLEYPHKVHGWLSGPLWQAISQCPFEDLPRLLAAINSEVAKIVTETIERRKAGEPRHRSKHELQIDRDAADQVERDYHQYLEDHCLENADWENDTLKDEDEEDEDE